MSVCMNTRCDTPTACGAFGYCRELNVSGKVKRFERIGRADLFLGDCLEILPHLPMADLVVIDPPYGMSFVSNYRLIKHDSIANDNELPIEAINVSIAHARCAAYVFCRWDNLREMPCPKSVIAWVKNNWSMGDLQHEHGRQWEACCFYPKDGHQFIKRIPDVIYAARTGNEEHPTQKPVGAITPILAANVGNVVLDSFMGSGTTGIAALNLNRSFVGIEIDESRFNVACERIENAQRQERLFA